MKSLFSFKQNNIYVWTNDYYILFLGKPLASVTLCKRDDELVIKLEENHFPTNFGEVELFKKLAKEEFKEERYLGKLFSEVDIVENLNIFVKTLDLQLKILNQGKKEFREVSLFYSLGGRACTGMMMESMFTKKE